MGVAKRVLVAGYYGFGNTGDEAILSALLADMRAFYPGLQFTVVSGNPDETSARHNVQSVVWNDPTAILDAVEASDLVLLGGGGLFQDHWGCPADTMLTRHHGGIPFYGAFPLLAAIRRKPCMLYAVGVGPLGCEDARRLTRTAFDLADIATVRDIESLSVLRSAKVECARVLVTADPAFSMVHSLENVANSQSHFGVRRGGLQVAVCLRSWDIGVAPEKWEAEIAAALDSFVEAHNASLVFVPFQRLPESSLTDDLLAAERVVARMRNRDAARLEVRLASPEEVARLLGHSDMVLGMRLHSLVFAIAGGVPAVALSYDAKVMSLMRRVGMEKCAVDLLSASSDDLVSAMNRAWEDREQIRAALARAGHRLREQAKENARLAVSLLDDEVSARQKPVDNGFLGELTLRLARQLEQCEEKIAEKDEAIRVWENRWKSLANSTAWGLLHWLWRTRLVLAPSKSRRERALRAAMRLIRTAGRNGSPRRFMSRLRERAKDGLPAWVLEAARHVKRGAPGCTRVFKRAVLRCLPTPIKSLLSDLEYRGHTLEDNSQVTVFCKDPGCFASYPRKELLPTGGRKIRVPVSLVVTVRNEHDSVGTWLETLAQQTRQPDEVIVVDGGSSDGTLAVVRDFASNSMIKVKVIAAGEVNIARGRNIGIQEAAHPIIATTDFGCELESQWLENLILPFELDPEVEVVAGWYRPTAHTWWGRAAASHLVPALCQVDPQSFLPSARSMAFRKYAWDVVGGYPEWLTSTGEDTYFGLELKRCCRKWAFVPDATVRWSAPETLQAAVRKAYRWSMGDGEAGLFPERYRRLAARSLLCIAKALVIGACALLAPNAQLLLLLLALIAAAGVAQVAHLARRQRIISRSDGDLRVVACWLVALAAISIARVCGFVAGVRSRSQALERRYATAKGLAYILSGVPISDSGGGQRCSQVARELLRRGFVVVFISKFPRYESVDLEVHLTHPNLVTITVDGVDARRLCRVHAHALKGRVQFALVEFPLSDFVPLVDTIRTEGGVIAYDLIDQWNSSLGSWGYRPDVERDIVEKSHILLATAPLLKRELEERAGREVLLLPNAVNIDVFSPHAHYERPTDLPAGDFVISYIGALWGEWFDWGLLREVALAYPQASVIAIGDYRGQCTNAPGNLHFLGLKPHEALPAYLAYTDVTIIPWTVCEITHATSPLKVYEYLAMHKPVVAPRLRALEGIPYVLLSDGHADFVANISRARTLAIDRGEIEAFVQENSWRQRVESLLTRIREAASEEGGRTESSDCQG